MSEINLEFKPETESEDTEPIKAVAEAVATTLKRSYTMSDLKKEQLVKARARAVELRTALNAIKPPTVETVKVKKPSKMEIEISEIEASKPAPLEPPPEPVAVTEPVIVAEPVLVKEPKQKVPVKKQKEAPIKQRKPLMTTPTPPPPPTPPPTGFRRNSFGFFVL